MIESVKYQTNFDGENDGLHVIINGVFTVVPLDPTNTTYAEIMRQVEAGTLTIAPADEE